VLLGPGIMTGLEKRNEQESGRRAVATVDAAWELGASRWPALKPARPRFEEHWNASASAGVPPVFVEDLFLAHACLDGDPAALRTFDATYVARVRTYVARFGFTASDVAEVEQLVRVRLLAGPTPKLAQYTGAGPLARWVRVAAVRVAVNFIASRPEHASAAEVSPEDVPDRAAGDLPDAEAQIVDLLMTARHRDLVRGVLGEALAYLPEHEKTVLRMYLLDGVAVENIARVFGVHRATVARWLSSIRSQMAGGVNDRLSLRLGAPASQVRNLFRGLRFDLELDMRGLLRAPREEARE
jgi:RNA polymerase sigma-70 factor (ECF subfamily)